MVISVSLWDNEEGNRARSATGQIAVAEESVTQRARCTQPDAIFLGRFMSLQDAAARRMPLSQTAAPESMPLVCVQ